MFCKSKEKQRKRKIPDDFCPISNILKNCIQVSAHPDVYSPWTTVNYRSVLMRILSLALYTHAFNGAAVGMLEGMQSSRWSSHYAHLCFWF